MRKSSLPIFFIAFSIFFARCGDKSSSVYPMGKRYWTPDDYMEVNNHLADLKYDKEQLPSLDNPRTNAIFQKIVDTTNFSIVATDDQLGLQHRKKFLNDMFEEYKDLLTVYTETDQTDKYKYPEELIAIEKFGLALQVYYFGIGNQEIIKGADDPSAADVVSIVNRNYNAMIDNYTLYLDNVNSEDRFTGKAMESYSEGLQAFFPRLINDIVPGGDYSDMRVKVDNMLKKTKNAAVAAQLQNIQNLLNSKLAAAQQPPQG